MMTLTVDKIV